MNARDFIRMKGFYLSRSVYFRILDKGEDSPLFWEAYRRNKNDIKDLFQNDDLDILGSHDQFPDIVDLVDEVEREQDVEFALTLLRLAFMIKINNAKSDLQRGHFLVNRSISYSSFDKPPRSESENTPYIEWFRGQTDYSWGLLPSFFRGLDAKNDLYVDASYICHAYNKNGRNLEQEYLTHIGGGVNNLYEMMAFMQHATSCSPLLDFTRDYHIASSFAVSNYDRIHDFNAKDASIYVLETNAQKIIHQEKEINDCLKDYWVLYSKNPIVLGKRMSFLKVDQQGQPMGQREEKTVWTFQAVLDLLKPSFYLIDIPTNDRMKFQKGTFILFTHFLMIGQQIFYNLNPNLYLWKVKIRADNIGHHKKTAILDDIRQRNRQYQMEYLLDPYSFFTTR